MNIAILFISCLASFAATVISLLFFLRYKKIFFFDVLLVLLSFFALSTESFFVSVRNAKDDGSSEQRESQISL